MKRCELCGQPWNRCKGHGRATPELKSNVMPAFLHVLEQAPGWRASDKIWDYRIWSPLSLDDAAVIRVEVTWVDDKTGQKAGDTVEFSIPLQAVFL